MDPTVLDTHPEAAAVQRAIWQRMGPTRRVELALQMSEDVRDLAIDGEMARNPSLSRRQAMLAVVRRQLGDDLFSAAFLR